MGTWATTAKSYIQDQVWLCTYGHRVVKKADASEASDRTVQRRLTLDRLRVTAAVPNIRIA